MGMGKLKLILIIVAAILSCWHATAEAARSFTVLQTVPAPGTAVDMGSTQAITFRVTNTNTPNNTAETITTLRFRVNSGSLFNAATAAPGGWNRTGFSTTQITFQASTAAFRIVTGGYLDFTIIINIRRTTADVALERLRDVRATYSAGNNVTVTTPGSWNLKSLSIVSFVITDLAGTPISGLTAGNGFRLVMTVKNNSSVSQTSIISNANPPATIEMGVVTQVLTGTVYAPNPLTLAASATGTITFTYTTNGNDGGTIYFTANARNNTNSATSAVANSTVLSVGKFSANLTIAPVVNCQYEGLQVTVTMRLTNNYPYNIINVTPVLAPSIGAPVVYVSGPTPGAPTGPVPASGGNFDFIWVYQVNGGNPGDLFTFTGQATGTGQTVGNPLYTTPQTTSTAVKRGGFSPTVSPISTNAGSTNEDLTWSITNQGCADVTQLSITIPAGWTLDGTDIYSLIDQNNPPNPGVNPIDPIENVWTVAGMNPVVFTTPAGKQLPLVNPPIGGDFNLVFSATPPAAGTSTFTLRITDANGTFVDRTTNVTVNAYGTGGDNTTAPAVYWEEIR